MRTAAFPSEAATMRRPIDITMSLTIRYQAVGSVASAKTTTKTA